MEATKHTFTLALPLRLCFDVFARGREGCFEKRERLYTGQLANSSHDTVAVHAVSGQFQQHDGGEKSARFKREIAVKQETCERCAVDSTNETYASFGLQFNH